MKTNITVKSSDSGHQAAYSQTSALLLNNYVTVGTDSLPSVPTSLKQPQK